MEEEDGDFGWLFLRDAGREKPNTGDRAAVAEWLALLHGTAATLAGRVALPDRGPEYFCGLLPELGDGLGASHAIASAARHPCDELLVMASAIHRLRARWERVVTACAAWPRTLVHADLSRKNIRLCRSDSAVNVVALDWETAGWGPPAVDLANLPWGGAGDRASEAATDRETCRSGPIALDVYATRIATYWPDLDRQEVKRASRVGAIFRVISAACWACHQVRAGGIDKGLCRLRAYCDDLIPAIDALN
jgi:hypothetical protein